MCYLILGIYIFYLCVSFILTIQVKILLTVSEFDRCFSKIWSFRAKTIKLASQEEYNTERFKIAQANMATYKKEIGQLESKKSSLQSDLSKHENAIQVGIILNRWSVRLRSLFTFSSSLFITAAYAFDWLYIFFCQVRLNTSRVFVLSWTFGLFQLPMNCCHSDLFIFLRWLAYFITSGSAQPTDGASV